MTTPIEDRFFTAASGTPPTDVQKRNLAAVHTATLALAVEIHARVPEGRDKSLALTHLEDVLMRANRGVFA